MVVPQKGDHVWIEVKTSGKGAPLVPIGARIKEIQKDQITVVDDEGKEFVLKPGTKIRHMHVSSLEGVEDMISLGDLNEAGILRNLLIRYRRNEIYTYTGQILVAVNPYAVLPIYTSAEVKAYRGRKIGELPPHIFAVADSAYSNMMRFATNQSVIISGESGAGKTESTKLILQFLAAVSGQHSWIEQQVLDSNPILEAFGNAKTIRNDNSSRFGKYIDIFFGPSGAIEGAKIDHFLLEKSRIVTQMRDERNYHVFYCMLDGLPLPMREKFGLGRSHDYHYLNQGGQINLVGCTDIVDYSSLRAAMKVLTFTDDECLAIFQLLAALLHLGNLDFQAALENNIDSCEVAADLEFELVSSLMQVEPTELRKALTTRTIVTRDDLVVTAMSLAQGINTRDALVKGTYGRLFVWLVDKINGAICRPSLTQTPRSGTHSCIGVLDIFGFENFDHNSFEQLCINYANETLQQFFVRTIFKMEQEDYAAELISWQHIAFTDNQDTLDLIGLKSCNVLALVDEESRFPRGSDHSLLNKLISSCGKHARFVKQKADIVKIFGIQHFAGAVHYEIEGFLEKNRDSFNADLVELIQSTQNQFLKVLFDKDFAMGFETRKRAPTLGLQFRRSLESLMKILLDREPFFIRCIKPNEFKQKLNFDRQLCLRQLRYSGMMETIRIRKAGYSIRHQFADFIDRYRVLLPDFPSSDKCKDVREVTKVMCKRILDPKGYQIGKTKLFLKDTQDLFLEESRDRMLSEKIVLIQKTWRGYLCRKRFRRQRKAAISIQTFVRTRLARRRFVKMKKGFSVLQACFRARVASRKLEDLKGFVRGLQRYCRGFLARERLKRRKAAVIKIQALTRRYIAMKRYNLIRQEDKKMKEALALKRKEESLLKRQMTAEKARAEAEKRHKVRLDEIHQQSVAEARDQQRLSSDKRRRIADAERRRNEPVDDREILDEILDSSDSYSSVSSSGSHGHGPRAFQDLEVSRLRALSEIGAALPSAVPDYLVSILDEDVSEFTLTKFAATYWQNDMDVDFSRRPLKKPLLFHPSKSDQMTALAVWVAILRFMKDLPEPVLQAGGDKAVLNGSSIPVMTELYQSLGRKSSFHDIMKTPEEFETKETGGQQENIALRSGRTNIVSLTLKKKSKFSGEVVTQLDPRGTHSVMDERPTTNLEKLHFIIGNGILLPQLRDEIFCQICKQLTNNPRRDSVSRGLILLTLCIGCFAPTEKFVRTLRNFIQSNYPDYAAFIVSRLQRTFSNGTRNQPPSWLELKAMKHKRPIILPVAFMNGSSQTVFADSASTAQELCLILSQKIALKDQFGFSMFIAILDKVSSIGSGGDHIMDAISQCEQFAKEAGLPKSKAQWRLFFRKEIFAPWHNPNEDRVATDLIYHQVVRGIKFGEYRSDFDQDLSRLCAYQMYVDNVKPPSEVNLNQYLPPSTTGHTRNKKKLIAMIGKTAKSLFESGQNRSNLCDKLKEEIVNFARLKWPMLFSRFYEAVKFAGPTLETNEIILTINWTGVYLVDSQERIHLELSFPEIVAISSSRTSRLHGQSLSLITVKGDNYTFNCANSEDIRDLIIFFLEGLKERSRYVISVQPFYKPDEQYLNCDQGDLLILEDSFNSKHLMSTEWYYGENYRTKESGLFPSDIIYVLPLIIFPSPSILALFSDKTFLGASDGQTDAGSKQLQHTLEEFSRIFFRSSPNDSKSFSLTPGRSDPGTLWRHSSQPLKAPLLKKLENNDELCQLAISAFSSILRYTENKPSKGYSSSDLIESIFAPCLKYDILKDEVYSQLVKQVTLNPNPQSEKSGWELIWLAAGIMVPSSNLYRELQDIFRTSKSQLAAECQDRLQKTLKLGQRRYPPHAIEINAVQMGKVIHHKIYFPNEAIQAFEITSNTKCKDLCQSICNKIGLNDYKGFALFVKSIDKAISMPEGDFFFDFIRQLNDWVKKHRPAKDGQLDFTYQVFFMKKLWTNTVPGFDAVADLIFHYPQEVRKYLYGYHKVTFKDVITLGALILRANCGEDNAKINTFLGSLEFLVPPDILSKQSPGDIQQRLLSQFYLSDGMSEDEAKTDFLKFIFQWPTFGSAFFDVKQSTNLKVPEKILIAINKNGVYLIHIKTKEILDHYPYSSISNWSSGNTYFNMTIGNLIHGRKLLCETPLGYKMDDLLTSYISLMLTAITKNSTT